MEGSDVIGSHLIGRLLDPGHEARCADTPFAGTKRNLHRLHEPGHLEFMRQDMTFPLHAEEDELHDPACPALPRHDRHDPVARLLRPMATDAAPVVHDARWGNRPSEPAAAPDDSLARTMDSFMMHREFNVTRLG